MTEIKETIKTVNINRLCRFPNNPYNVKEDLELQESIKANGIINPLIVRSIGLSCYEIISGHRRLAACEALGIDKVPVNLRVLSDAEATIAVVDSNLHREHILLSEKARAYKMKLDALKCRGKRTDLDGTSGQDVPKSREKVSECESGRQIQRIVRLNELIPQLLQMVDEGKIAFTNSVELSYLSHSEQEDLLEVMGNLNKTPSSAQAIRMKNISDDDMLTTDMISEIMTEEKPKSKPKEQLKLSVDSIRGFFPADCDAKSMTKIIMELLAEWQTKRESVEGVYVEN